MGGGVRKGRSGRKRDILGNSKLTSCHEAAGYVKGLVVGKRVSVRVSVRVGVVMIGVRVGVWFGVMARVWDRW